MQRICKELPRNCEIISMTCTHHGSIMCHNDGIDFAVDYIASHPRCYALDLGDMIEAVATDDKRYNQPPEGMKELDESVPIRQAKQVIKRYKPIRKKLITILKGNHERYLQRIANFAQYIADELKVPYGTETCRIILENNGKSLFNIQAMHGTRLFNSKAKDYEQRLANKQAALKLYLQEQMGDCAIHLCGHAHQILIVPPAKRLYFVDGTDGVHQQYLKGSTQSGYIDPDQRWYACCGSARKSRLDGFDDYAQNYSPVELGFVRIIVDCGQIVKLEPFLI